MENNIKELAKLVRYYCLVSTTKAGSGHPTSSLSAVDIMVALMFGGNFKFDLENPKNPNNDRLIFSKGHASPLFYSLYAAAGKVSEEELLTLRTFGSRFEGHPTLEFPYTEVPTGSLGQGLSVGLGMALNAKLEKRDYKTFVLLGDSEIAEGSVWEAMGLASYYKLNNLVGILDVNRLGQRGETMLGDNTETYQKRVEAFGWKTIVIDGHNFEEIASAYQHVRLSADQPFMIIAKTLKGKGVSFLEDKDSWHGKALSQEELEKALVEIGNVDKTMVGKIEKPGTVNSTQYTEENKSVYSIPFTQYSPEKKIATRKAYGNVLANLVDVNPQIIVLDAETSNSTFADTVKKKHLEKFVECFIAEQNMVGMALGFSKRGKIPFVSTFAAFLSRAFDQIRMSALSDANIKFIGSHAGVSIGEDGASQMGLEEIAMFRTLLNSVVLYPSDAVSTEKLVLEAAKHHGNVYIQTTRKETTIVYSNQQTVNSKQQTNLVEHEFKIGGSCVLKSSDKDQATVIGAGVTLHEALKAYEELLNEGINIRVIDLYSIKPIDTETLKKAAEETKNIITVEDNFKEGGIYEAVASSLASVSSLSSYKVKSLAVTKMPRSGKPEELLAFEEIDSTSIVNTIKSLLSTNKLQ